MNILIFIHSYNGYGSHATMSIVGGFLGLGVPSFGDGLNEIYVEMFFRNSAEPKPGLELTYKTFLTQIKNLPSIVFYRKKRRIELKYISTITDAEGISTFQPPQMNLFKQAVVEVAAQLKSIRSKVKKYDDFLVESFLSAMDEKISSLPNSTGEFASLVEQVESIRRKKSEAMDEWEKLGIDWEDYHPKARKILDIPFFWECANDFAPNGNDTGADILGMYKEWRVENKKNSAEVFFNELMSEWEVKIPALKDDEFSFTTFTEASIGLAFAQIKVDGKCEASIKQQALESIEMLASLSKESVVDEMTFEERQNSLKLLATKLESI